MSGDSNSLATSTPVEETPPGSCLASSFPVELPEDALLTASAEEFQAHLTNELRTHQERVAISPNQPANLDIALPVRSARTGSFGMAATEVAPSIASSETLTDNMTLTANLDPAHATTGFALLDLFVELEASVSGQRLKELLNNAWSEYPLATLKVVFNARSIHLGKSDQKTFYRCIGWMKEQHPETAICNLPWLYRSIIAKTAAKDNETAEDDEMEVVDAVDDPIEPVPDIVNGGAHGYWKDLLSLLVLAAEEKLDAFVDTDAVLHAPNENGPKDRKRRRADPGSVGSLFDKQTAKQRKHKQENDRHENILRMLTDPFYRLLHLSVARQFAAQLRKDKMILVSEDKEAMHKISLAAKWAPSIEGFHDKHTFVVSSIAEILYPASTFSTEFPNENREMYLKRARANYHRLTLAPLRKALKIVERDISAEHFNCINYKAVPSIAMNTYKKVFVKKDFERFEQYIDLVAQGKARINASILSPSLLVSQARSNYATSGRPAKSAKELMDQKTADVQAKALNGQWNDLVKRTKEAGKLASAIAICDTSGSMCGPIFRDKTTPVDTAIGLSLLLAEVLEPPFGGSFITFSSNPQVVSVGGPDDTRSFRGKVKLIERSSWTMNTDFTAVFERLLLPAAIEYNVKPENMVKTVFVFSDMQFDTADDSWSTSHERIAERYKEHGYELPRLVYWNINGGYHNRGKGMPKPVTKDIDEALMVSGYSSAMLKVFLDGGTFEGSLDDDEEMDEVVQTERGSIETRKAKKTVNPMDAVWRAINHKAYDGLKVVD